MIEAQSSERFLGQFIPVHYHYQMLFDRARMDGFRLALERAVPPGGKVVDLGGGTGILSFFAARRASRVWCVEWNPELARAARGFLKDNGCGDKVELVEMNAAEFTPPEQVDVVVCEMLHTALLREKQLQVIRGFKQNYLKRFGEVKLPRFIPEATLLACQPVQQSFEFDGYRAPLPVFFPPHEVETGTLPLAEPLIYATLEYRAELDENLEVEYLAAINSPGTLNGVRFITKNVLAILLEDQRTIDWHNFYLVIPLPEPFAVNAGDQVRIRFSYRAGGELAELISSLEVLAPSR